LYLSSNILNDKRKLLNILKELKNKKLEKLEPSFVAGIGPLYKDIENRIKTFEEQTEFLKKLESMGIVKSKEGKPIIICPICKKFIFLLRFICSYCKSLDIKSGQAIEHDLCHNIDFEDKYQMASDDSLKCNKCNKLLKAIGVDYSKINIFKCIDCNGISSYPEQQYICVSCGLINSKTELLISNLFDYSICESKLNTLINNLEYLLPVVEELDRLGIKSIYPATTGGISGMTHNFDLIAYDYYNKIFLILETLESTNNFIYGNMENLVLSFVGKCSDFDIPNKILVTFEELPINLSNLLKINKIKVLNMNNIEESAIDIVQLISELFNNAIEKETIIQNEK
jgi:hypothetical protein